MPLPPMTPTTLRRLALIKYMFEQGVAQSQQPSPLLVVALLHFQDAAELFLHLACEHHHVTVPKQTQFLDYWTLLVGVGPVRQEPGMDRLNKARVAFKHHGNLPSDHDMEDFRVTATNFFTENTVILFGQTFDEISLVDLVTCKRAREYLKEAEGHWASNAGEKAREAIALAFSVLIRDYGERKKDPHWGSSPFDFGPRVRAPSDPMREQSREQREFAKDTSEAIGALQAITSMLSFGLDYRKYALFSRLVPTVSWSIAETPMINRGMRVAPALQKADFDYCYNFVIECAVTLQRFDYTA